MWMAVADNSDDENMADNKFDDFTIFENELFFEENEDGNVLDLTACLK